MSWVELGGWEVTVSFSPEVLHVKHIFRAETTRLERASPGGTKADRSPLSSAAEGAQSRGRGRLQGPARHRASCWVTARAAPPAPRGSDDCAVPRATKFESAGPARLRPAPLLAAPGSSAQVSLGARRPRFAAATPPRGPPKRSGFGLCGAGGVGRRRWGGVRGPLQGASSAAGIRALAATLQKVLPGQHSALLKELCDSVTARRLSQSDSSNWGHLQKLPLGPDKGAESLAQACERGRWRWGSVGGPQREDRLLGQGHACGTGGWSLGGDRRRRPAAEKGQPMRELGPERGSRALRSIMTRGE
ncbi:hypothetical protein AB1E19_007663 [Capra hircus]